MTPQVASVLPILDVVWGLSDTPKRSLLKTLSWRITGSGATFLISWLIAGDFVMASTIAVIQLIVNTVLYFFHERIWNQVGWGRR